jgi:hypothetical protein
MYEVRKSIVIRQLNDALNTRNNSSSILIYNLSLNFDVLMFRERNDNQSKSWKNSFKFVNVNDKSMIIEFSSDSIKFRSTMIKSYYDDNYFENSFAFYLEHWFLVHRNYLKIIEYVSIEWLICCFDRSKIKI